MLGNIAEERISQSHRCLSLILRFVRVLCFIPGDRNLHIRHNGSRSILKTLVLSVSYVFLFADSSILVFRTERFMVHRLALCHAGEQQKAALE